MRVADINQGRLFTGQYLDIAKIRQTALDRAYAKHPERFIRGRPVVRLPAQEVFINPIPADADQSTVDKGVNFPTLARAMRK